MSHDYDKRYNVHANQVSHYTDDPAEALRMLDSDPERGFCNAGYARDRDVFSNGDFLGTEITRCTTGSVLRSTLAFRAQRAAVQDMRAKIQST